MSGRRRARSRTHPITVGFEVLLTVGVLTCGYLGWKLTPDPPAPPVQVEAAGLASDDWEAEFASLSRRTGPELERIADEEYRNLNTDPADIGTVVGVLYAPRLGDQFKVTILEGTNKDDILDTGAAGRYQQTAQLGGAGNAVITAHRSAYGSPFWNLAELRVGDPIYVETVDGWYEYRYRNSAYVDPSQISVLNDWPDTENIGFDHLLTLISCNPRYVASERLVAYALLESFTPRSEPAPADVAPLLDIEPDRGVHW
ncbi:sortase [Agromyces humi]|uniref:sortase n=1 Tax=Agromyces humi TaxID=1766800 RepID=UPI00135A9325|nr:sortase [Agromyces humi]